MITDLEARQAIERQEQIIEQLAKAYVDQLDSEMGQLHNQFVTFIAMSNLPLPQVILVLEMLVRETVDQARKRYIGE